MVELDKFVFALERTLELIQNSKYDGGLVCLEESIPLLEKQLADYRKNGKFGFWGKCKLRFLFLPTNELQEISIINGWGDEYLKIAETVDCYLN